MTIESQATPEVQAEAAKIGWQGPSAFKGEPEAFVDADEYLKRAETVLPIVRENNKRLQADLADMRSRLEAEVAKSAGLAKRMEDIDIEHSARLAKEVKRAKEEAVADLEAALEAGDHKLAAKLTKQVAALEQVEDTPPKEEKPAPVDHSNDPAVRQWNAWAEEVKWAEWSQRDKREFLLVGEELRMKGNRNLGRAFVDDVLREIEKDKKPSAFEEQESRVAEGKGSGAPRGGKKQGYDALTAEEKKACDADSRNFVGKGKKFADIAAYRANWAQIYQGME